MRIIDGKKIAKGILVELKKEVESKKIKPCLAIVLVGDNSSSLLYIKAKEKAAAQIGVKVEKFLLPKKSSESQILKIIGELNKNSDIDGILIQLPLPKGISPDRIIKEIDPKKDIDGLLPDSGLDSPFILSIWEALKATKEDLGNKKILALVNSEVFGKKLGKFFKRKGLEIDWIIPKRCHAGLDPASSVTKRWSEYWIPGQARNDKKSATTREADVLITALGKPGIIDSAVIKKNVILIDGGISRVDYKTLGDIDEGSVKQKAKWLSPVPGGLGPLTVAFLLKNLI